MISTKQQRVECGPWAGSFSVDGVDGGPIRLEQIGSKSFALTSKLEYTGPTGLEGNDLDAAVLSEIRTLDPRQFPNGKFETDLASVPGPARWFVRSYGVYTPAALIHDRLIPATQAGLEGMTDQYADRYFRYMLQHLDVGWLKRWLVWAAVATRTRVMSGTLCRIGLSVWAVSALIGMWSLTVGLVAGNVPMIVTAAIAPVPCAALWGKQYGAGLIPSFAAPWLLPPILMAAIGHGIYQLLETLCVAVMSFHSPAERTQPERTRPAHQALWQEASPT